MTRSLTKSALSLTALGAMLAVLHAAPVMAVPFIKTYVSNTGDDNNDCSTIATPCAHFQIALDRLIGGGEITVLNTGDYGPNILNIDKSVHITNDGAGEASIRPNGTAPGVSINAGAGDVVSLRGLVIDGSGIVQGFGNARVGIEIQGASAVHIQNCVIRNFEDSNAFGIVLIPNARTRLFISDTIIYNNGTQSLTGGILIEPQNANSNVDVVLDRVHLENNVDGLLIDGLVTSGPGSHVVVRDSVISGNAANGIHALTRPGMSPAFAFVEHSSMVNNGQSGILADGAGATVLLNDNTITRNGAGISAINGGQLISYGNNKNNNNLGPEGAPTGFYSQM